MPLSLASATVTGPAVPSTETDAVERPAARAPRRPIWQSLLTVVGALAVVLVHFRPWQGGLLEDWGFALVWSSEGLSAYGNRVDAQLGRPLHQLPHYLGLALSDGGFVGVYGVLAAVGVAQFLLAMWAIRPLTSSWGLRWALALTVALHPWWLAGDILRFLPAQVATLSVVVWLGAGIRFLDGGRRRWLVLLGVAPALGLLTYQAPAAAFLGGAVALAVIKAVSRRGVILVLVTTGAVASVLLWSAVIAPRISPDSYESQLLTGGVGGPLGLVRAALRTLTLHGEGVLLMLCVTGVAVLALGLAQQLRQWQVWTLLAIVGGSPLAALAYGSNPLHLNDPERLVLPVGVLLWLVLAAVAGAMSRHRFVVIGVVAAALLGVLAGSVAGYVRWAGYAEAQQDLIQAAGKARADLPADARLVVADSTGRYGDIYLLLPPHLDMAMDVEFGDGAETVLCTPTGVVRDHPDAALFPLSTTPDCATFLGGPGAHRMGTVQTALGEVELYAVP
jgi:hypothetical protein